VQVAWEEPVVSDVFLFVSHPWKTQTLVTPRYPTFAGYTVQTLRIATRILWFGDHYDDPITVRRIATALETASLRHGISFCSLGASGPAASRGFLQNKGSISTLAGSLTNTSFTVGWQPGWDIQEARTLAAEIFAVAQSPVAGASFRFGISFKPARNCPYFPMATAGEEEGFSLGLENSGLLDHAFSAGSSQSSGLNGAASSLFTTMSDALAPIEALSRALEGIPGSPKANYLGIDSSIAPSLEPPCVTSAFRNLGLGFFGDCGTLAVTEKITGVLKSLPIKLCGYCGLMLPVCEDRGLAEAASNRLISIQTLLQYSSVCGVGLDTVPIPGLTGTEAESEKNLLINKVAAILLDVASLSSRLDKPLSVRLLPVPGAVPGDRTNFQNPYLVESTVMRL
jgi:hypothetical protein